MRFKNFLLFLILFICMFFLTGCYTSQSVETKAYVVAMGIDNRGEKHI